jgi:hypothetical protein
MTGTLIPLRLTASVLSKRDQNKDLGSIIDILIHT